MILPKRIFFTGAPGTNWCGISRVLEKQPGFNTTDRSPEREYTNDTVPGFRGHCGSYFGNGMEFPADANNTDVAFSDPSAGTMLIKSHEWALDLGNTWVECKKSGDWLLMVYRPTDVCVEWWQKAGGFDITYPDYSWYKDNAGIEYATRVMNENMLRFGFKLGLSWEYLTPAWLRSNFGLVSVGDTPNFDDILVTVAKP